MGYTHYFAYDPSAASFIDAWPRVVADARMIAAYLQGELGVRLTDGVGEGEPVITVRRIWLNGPTAGELGHEAFLIDPMPWKA